MALQLHPPCHMVPRSYSKGLLQHTPELEPAPKVPLATLLHGIQQVEDPVRVWPDPRHSITLIRFVHSKSKCSRCKICNTCRWILL